MGLKQNVEYRFELARGFLNEAEQDYSLNRWRACVAASIIVIENTGLIVLMLFGVSSFTHKPGLHLSQLISEGTVAEDIALLVNELLPDLEKYDSYQKMLAKYGDEFSYKLPWEIFNEHEGLMAIESARKCFRVSSEIAELFSNSTKKLL